MCRFLKEINDHILKGRTNFTTDTHELSKMSELFG